MRTEQQLRDELDAITKLMDEHGGDIYGPDWSKLVGAQIALEWALNQSARCVSHEVRQAMQRGETKARL